MAGDAKTGMMIMKMDEGLDTGAVALVRSRSAADDGGRTARPADAGRRRGDGGGPGEARSRRCRCPQPADGVTYAAKIDKAETRIDFPGDASVHNHIRGLSPFPGAWFELEIGGKPERLKVLAPNWLKGTVLPGIARR